MMVSCKVVQQRGTEMVHVYPCLLYLPSAFFVVAVPGCYVPSEGFPGWDCLLKI